MSNFIALAPDEAPASAKPALTTVHTWLGATPNMFRVAANSPPALNALVQMSGSLAKGRLARARGSPTPKSHKLAKATRRAHTPTLY